MFLIIRNHYILWLHLDIQSFWNILQDKSHSFTFLAQEYASMASFPSCLFSTYYLLGDPGYIYFFYQMFSLVMLCRYSFASQWIYSSVVIHDYTQPTGIITNFNLFSSGFFFFIFHPLDIEKSLLKL